MYHSWCQSFLLISTILLGLGVSLISKCSVHALCMYEYGNGYGMGIGTKYSIFKKIKILVSLYNNF
jgi:hypothetical protein